MILFYCVVFPPISSIHGNLLAHSILKRLLYVTRFVASGDYNPDGGSSTEFPKLFVYPLGTWRQNLGVFPLVLSFSTDVSLSRRGIDPERPSPILSSSHHPATVRAIPSHDHDNPGCLRTIKRWKTYCKPMPSGLKLFMNPIRIFFQYPPRVHRPPRSVVLISLNLRPPRLGFPCNVSGS